MGVDDGAVTVEAPLHVHLRFARGASMLRGEVPRFAPASAALMPRFVPRPAEVGGSVAAEAEGTLEFFLPFAVGTS